MPPNSIQFPAKGESDGGGGVAADYSWSLVCHFGAAGNADVVATVAVLKAVVVRKQRWCSVCLNLKEALPRHSPILILLQEQLCQSPLLQALPQHHKDPMMLMLMIPVA